MGTEKRYSQRRGDMGDCGYIWMVERANGLGGKS